MKLFTNTRSIATACCLTLLVGAARSQTVNDGHTIEKEVGSGEAKGWLKAGAEFTADAAKAYAEAHAYGKMTAVVLGFKSKVWGHLYATANANRGPVAGAEFRASIEVNEKVVWEKSVGFLAEYTKEIGPYYPVKIKYKMTVGPIPVTVTGEVGVGGDATVRVARFDPRKLTLTSTTDAAFGGKGKLKVGVDLALVYVGISTDLTFGELSADGSVVVSLDGLDGSLTGYLNAVALKSYVEVEYWVPFVGWESEKEKLFSWSSGKKSVAGKTW